MCSPYTSEINRAVELLGGKTEVLILDPSNLDDILQDIIKIGNKIGRQEKARDFVIQLQKRIDYIKNIQKISRPKVLCIEWLNPLFTGWSLGSSDGRDGRWYKWNKFYRR